MDFSALAHREVLVESVRMTGWRMAVETWPNGRHSFPQLHARPHAAARPKRFVTTVRSVVAIDGEFDFEDHGVPWRTVARNLEVTVEKTTGYGGTAKFRNGTVAIQQYLPMQTDMDGVFTIDGAAGEVQPAAAALGRIALGHHRRGGYVPSGPSRRGRSSRSSTSRGCARSSSRARSGCSAARDISPASSISSRAAAS